MAEEKVEIIKSVEHYITWSKSLGVGDFIYRGQADESWALRSGAARRMYDVYKKVDFEEIKDYNEELLESAKLKGFDKKDNHHLGELELFAELQHHGAATPLLDFSKNALVALWMACSELNDHDYNDCHILTGTVDCQDCQNGKCHKKFKDGKIFALDLSESEKFNKVKTYDLKKNFSDLIKEGNAWHWEPAHSNRRIPVQSSIFLFGVEEYSFKPHEMKICKHAKKDIINQLNSHFNIKEEFIYPDLVGFAQANAAQKPYGKTEKELFSHAVKLRDNKKYEKALKAFNKLVKMNDQEAKYFFQLGCVNGMLGKFLEAIDCNEKALKLYGYSEETRNNRAICYSNLGTIKDDMGDYRGAIKDYNESIELNPQHGETYCNRGNTKVRLKDYEGAIANYTEAFKLNAENELFIYHRGIAKGYSGDYIGAIEDYSKAIELNPQYANAYNNRGAAKESLGDYEGAIKDYGEAIKLNPDLNIAVNNKKLAEEKLRKIKGL